MIKIVFWLDVYPNVMYSLLYNISKKNNIELTVFSPKHISKEVEEMYSFSKNINIRIIERNISKNEIKKIINDTKNHIHFFGGFNGLPGIALKEYRKLNLKQAFLFLEKPSVLPYLKYNFLLKNLKLLYLKYIFIKRFLIYRNNIKGVFVTGVKGKLFFTRLGIFKNRVYNFMYTHNDSINLISNNMNHHNDIIKFLYIGRFDNLYRGLDNLVYSFNKLYQKNWVLDLVGGYGTNANDIMEWANKTENVNYIGLWKSSDVINNMKNYDVCISPTRVDGWRIQINQAITAGIGSITTNEAISDELIEASKSGIVVNAWKKEELLKAVQFVCDNPNIVKEWKKNANDFAPKISNEIVAEYFVNILEYSLNIRKEIPVCPWKV